MELFRIFGVVDMKDNASDDIAKIDKKGKGLAGSLSSIGPIAATAGLALGGILVSQIKAGVDGLSEYQDKTAQLDAVLKSTGGQAGVTAEQVKALADEMQLSTKFTAEAALETSNLLLTFTNIGAGVFEDTVRIAGDMATALGTDMSGSAIQLGKALNDPTEGLTALTRVGVTFTEEQKNLIASMQASGDMAGAQTIILQELQKEFGGSAEAAGKTFSGQLAILGNAFGEVQETIASGMMPNLQAFAEYIVLHMPEIQQFVTDAMGASNEAFTEVWKIIVRLTNVIKELYEIVKPAMPFISGVVKIAMQELAGYVNGAITVFEALVVTIQKAIDIVTAFANLQGATSVGGRLAEEGLRSSALSPISVASASTGTRSTGGNVITNNIVVNDGFNGVKRELNRMGWSTP